MDVKIITNERYMKGAILELTPYELLLIQAAMWEFRLNKLRNFNDRIAANKMYGQICDAVKEADKKTCETCRHWKYIAKEWQCETIKCQGYEPKDEPQQVMSKLASVENTTAE